MTSQNVFSGLRVPFGERDGKMWGPEEVPRGKGCGCRCPDPRCGAELIHKYRKDTQRHYFAHHKAPDCPGGVESALHKMGKQVIQEAGLVTLPAPEFPHQGLDGAAAYCPETETLGLSNVQTEKAAGLWIPDVTVLTPEGEILYIEILVSHAVEEGKAEALDNLFEIDLGDVTPEQIQDTELFRKFVLHQAPRKWYRVSRYNAGIDDRMLAYHGETRDVMRTMESPTNVRQHSVELTQSDAYVKAKETIRHYGALPEYKGVDRPGRYVDVELDHDWVVGTHRLVWQSYLLFGYFLTLRLQTSLRPHDVIGKVEKRFGLHPAAKALADMTPFERKWLAIDPMLTPNVATHVIEEYMMHLATSGVGPERRQAVLSLAQGNYFILVNQSIGVTGGQALSYAADLKKVSRPKQPVPENTRPQPIPDHLIPFVRQGKQYVSICRRCRTIVGDAVKRCGTCHGKDMEHRFIGELRLPQ